MFGAHYATYKTGHNRKNHEYQSTLKERNPLLPKLCPKVYYIAHILDSRGKIDVSRSAVFHAGDTPYVDFYALHQYYLYR